MPKLKSEILESHINNIKTARDHVPDNSLNAFDNVVGVGSMAVNVLQLGEAVKNIFTYIKTPKITNQG